MSALRFAALSLACVALTAGSAPAPLRGFDTRAAADERTAEERFLDLPSAQGALNFATAIGARPHYAGSDGDRALAVMMRDALRQFGFDAELETFSARVDEPRVLALELITDPAYVPLTTAFKRARGTPPVRLDLREVPEPADPPTAQSEVGIPFNAGSADGDVTAPLVYAGKGRDADYATLDRARVRVAGAVVLVRYGAQVRGQLAERAQGRGAAGVIFYSDPADDGAARGRVYPDGPWRPATAVQRGAVGDRIRIPTLPVSSANARTLLGALRGAPAPPGWAGALPVAYPLARGPALVHLAVKLQRTTKTLWNTVGRIAGIAGAQSVVLGAHRDAWVAGVTDNGAGIATLLETARGLGYLARSGWRPRRTIVIAGWDGEELGELGSREYVRRHAAELRAGCVAYLNADENITGARIDANAAAAIAQTVVDATRDVPDPAAGRRSIYDRWFAQTRRDPRPAAPGGGSDHEAFLFDQGIPAADFRFEGPFGVYHSSYDTVRYAATFGDPGFVLHRTAAQIYGLTAMRLAGATAIPYVFSGYVTLLRSGVALATARAQRAGVSLDTRALRGAVDGLSAAAARADARIASGAPFAAERELAAAHELDRLAYGVSDYASTAFPAIEAAFAVQQPGAPAAAVAEAAAAVERATSALAGI